MCAAELDFPFSKRPVVVLTNDMLVRFAHLFIPNSSVRLFLAIILVAYRSLQQQRRAGVIID